jgi:ribosome-binding protein aMBF1 (putative translation factor)
MKKPVWSWVDEPEHARPEAVRTGRYSRPLSIRDKIVVKAFGEEVRRLRLMRGYSTHELAKKLSMSQPNLLNLEKGRGNVEIRLLWDFADALGVKPAAFLKVCDLAIDAALNPSGVP